MRKSSAHRKPFVVTQYQIQDTLAVCAYENICRDDQQTYKRCSQIRIEKLRKQAMASKVVRGGKGEKVKVSGYGKRKVKVCGKDDNMKVRVFGKGDSRKVKENT